MSITIVFAAHAGLPVLIDGSAGVTIFFFLSGYLITTLMRAELEHTGRVSLRNFYLRRVMRIFPPMYIALALGALVAAQILDEELAAPAMITAATHLTNYQIIGSGRQGLPTNMLALWSLAVEEHFYLVFPFIFLGLVKWLPRSRSRQTMVLAAICGAVLLWRCWLVFGADASFDRVYLATDTRLDSILFGSLLAVAFNPALDKVRGSQALWTRLLLPLGCAAFYIATIAPNNIELSVGYTVEGCALMLIFITLIAFPATPLARLLNLRTVAFVGVLSYSFYLLHRIAIEVVARRFDNGRWSNAVVAAGLALAASYLMYRLVEKPIARLRRRLSAQARAQAPTETVTAASDAVALAPD